MQLVVKWFLTGLWWRAEGFSRSHFRLHSAGSLPPCGLTLCGHTGGNHLLGNYPGDGYSKDACPKVTEDVDAALAAAELKGQSASANLQSHLVLVVPHAGYAYSGTVAAQGYLLAQAAGPFDLVVLVGFYHNRRFPGAVFGGQVCAGPVVNEKAALFLQTSMGLSDVKINNGTDVNPEHSLEQQMPFLSRIGMLAGSERLIPIMLGDDSFALAEKLATSLTNLVSQPAYNGKRMLVVVSSDLSHFLPEAQEELLDNRTLHNMISLQAPALADYFNKLEANDEELGMEGKQEFPCGRGGILFASSLADQLGLSNRTVLAQGSSFRSARQPKQGADKAVVGYGAVSFSAAEVRSNITRSRSVSDSSGSQVCDDKLSSAQMAALAWLAEREVRVQTLRAANYTGPEEAKDAEPAAPTPGAAVLRSLLHCKPRGAFVTIYSNRTSEPRTLRGCVGCAKAGSCFGASMDQRLPAVVTTAAFMATARDSRFQNNRLKVSELKSLFVEVSVLTTPEPVELNAVSEGNGLLLTAQGPPVREGLLLPDVWHDLWAYGDDSEERRREFVRLLETEKAGLPEMSWSELASQIHNGAVQLKRFSSQVFTSSSQSQYADF